MSEQFAISSPWAVWHPPTPLSKRSNEQSRNSSASNAREYSPSNHLDTGSRRQPQDCSVRASWHKFQYMLDKGSQAMSYDINQSAKERIFTEVCIELENDPRNKGLATWEIELLADPIAKERFFDEDYYTDAGHPSLSAHERNR